MVLRVGKQNKGAEQQFQQLAARLDMVYLRISGIESQPSRHLLKKTTEINKETTDVHLRDLTVSLETGAEYLQTSFTGRAGVSNPTLPSRVPCLQLSKLEPSPVHCGPQGAQECRTPVAKTQPDEPKICPTTFSGNTSWDDYLAQFELVAEINRWDDSMKATYLAQPKQSWVTYNPRLERTCPCCQIRNRKSTSLSNGPEEPFSPGGWDCWSSHKRSAD